MNKEVTGFASKDRPWLKYYAPEAANVVLPEGTMYDYIKDSNADNMDRIGVNYYGTHITYGRLIRETDRVAGALQSMGVMPGDMVTVCMVNSPETVYLILALSKIGAVANMVYAVSTVKELHQYMTDTKSKLVFVLDVFRDKIAEAMVGTAVEKVVVVGTVQAMAWYMRLGARLAKKLPTIPPINDPRFLSWKQFIVNTGDSRTCHDGDAAAVITYTGGTTGGSKGVVLSNKAVNAISVQYLAAEKCITRDEKCIQALPMFIAYGITTALIAPLARGVELTIRIPLAETVLDIFKKFKPSVLMHGPAYWEEMADSNEEIDLSNLKMAISGGDALRPAVEEKVNAYLHRCHAKTELLNGYGMTEVCAAASFNYSFAHRYGSVGIPFAHTIIAAFDPDTGVELPIGKEGEICIHSPSMLTEYVNNPEETENLKRLHEDGRYWVHSGDLGYVDEDGFVFISGRIKRYIKYVHHGVFKKVFSLDIEKVLTKHPSVSNCAVVPMDDPETMQCAVAYVIPKEGCGDLAAAEADIRRYCEENLDGGYRPKKYIFVDKFPLTKIGKVDYRALEKQLAEQTAPVAV